MVAFEIYYLAIIVDDKLTFWSYPESVVRKVEVNLGVLTKIMSNVASYNNRNIESINMDLKKGKNVQENHKRQKPRH